MVLPERFELSTSPLPRECSTPELRQRSRWRVTRRNRQATQVGRCSFLPCSYAPLQLDPPGWVLYVGRMSAKKPSETEKSARKTREDRLKAALKANIQRRKAQAKARASESADEDKS